jgi:hypothetical protein
MIFVPACLDELDLSAATFRVYAHIARRAGLGECFPGIDSMAQSCRLHKETVIESIKELEEKKMILVRRESGKTNRYRLTKPEAWGVQPVGNGERLWCGDVSEMGNAPVGNGERKGIQLSVSNPPLPPTVVVNDNGHKARNTEKTERSEAHRAASERELQEFCKSIGVEADAEYLWLKWQENGWTNGGKRIKDWRMTIRTWKAGRFLPSQKNPVRIQSKSPAGRMW